MSTQLCNPNEKACNNNQTHEYIKPHYEVEDSPQSYDIRVYLPGVPKDTTTITLENEILTIKGDKQQHWQDSWTEKRREINTENYRLDLQLNAKINREKISATHEHGILKIHLPVAEEAKPKTIKID